MKLSALRALLPVAITLAVFAPVLMVSWPRAETPPPTPIALTPGAWPTFGGTPHRNMVNAIDRNIPEGWGGAGSSRIKWVAPLGSRCYSSPTIVGDRVFIGTNNNAPRDPTVKGDKGILMCFRAQDGRFLWQAVHDKLPAGQVNDWPGEGLPSTPAVDGPFVYYVSNRCELVCAYVNGNPLTRSAVIRWKLDMMKELKVFPHNMSCCSPLVVGDLVFVVTSNGIDESHVNLPAPDAPSFVAVDKHTGKVRWQSNLPGKNIMHGQWGNPAYGIGKDGRGQVIFPGGDGWLYSFEPETGKLIWKFDANPKDSTYALGGRGTRSDFIATPVVVGNRLIIGTGQDPEHYEGVGHLWCIDINGRDDVSPELVADSKVSPPKTSSNPNSAVIWHYGGPVAREDINDKQRNPYQRDYYFGRTMSTVAVHDGLVYASELAGYMHCLDFETGKPYWVHDLKASVWGSPYWVDNKVFIGTEDGDVWIFQPGKKRRVMNTIPMNWPIRSTPTVANGVLYLATESHLIAIGN
jgi:outer membrane protein assembly factor BamB